MANLGRYVGGAAHELLCLRRDEVFSLMRLHAISHRGQVLRRAGVGFSAGRRARHSIQGLALPTLTLLMSVLTEQAWAQSQLDTNSAAGSRDPVRESVEEAIHPDATFTGDVFANAAGGRERGVVHTGNMQLTMRVESEPLIGWSGAQLFVHTLTTFGGQSSRLVADAQGVDNASTLPATLSLYEAWASQRFLRNRVSVLVGFYDLNSEFDVSFPGTVFVHSAQGMGSALGLSGVAGPSIYPVTSLGARIKLVPSAAAYVQVAVLNGRPGNIGGPMGARLPHAQDGALVVLEGGGFYDLMDAQDSTPGARRSYIRRQRQPRYRVKAAFGAWGYTARFPDVASYALSERPAVHRGDYGVYALVDALLLQTGTDNRRGLWAFARVGTSRPQVNRYPFFMGAGVVYRGVFAARDHDEVGCAVAAAKASARYQNARLANGEPSSGYEVAYELTYLALITPWLILQADLQYIVNPSARPDIANALAGILRYQLTF